MIHCAIISDDNTLRSQIDSVIQSPGSFDTLVLDRENQVTGLRMRSWIDRSSGMAVKIQVLQLMVSNHHS